MKNVIGKLIKNITKNITNSTTKRTKSNAEILCEELGIFGALIAIILFALLVIRGIKIALNANDTYSRLVAIGISIKMAIQALLNIAVVTNSIPNTGISLPFFSYGGSSLVMVFFEMGLLLAISRKAKILK